MLLCLNLIPTQAIADNLTHKQHVMQQLQSTAAENARTLTSEQQKALSIQATIDNYQTIIDQLGSQIHANKQQVGAAESKLKQIQAKLSNIEKELAKANQDCKRLMLAIYEDGGVPYIEVLLGATSFGDLISRLNSLVILTKSEHNIENRNVALQVNMTHAKQEQAATYQTLLDKKSQLQSLQQMDKGIQKQKKIALADSNSRIQGASSKQNLLNAQIQMTQSQIDEMRKQISESVSILSTSAADVTEPELRYHNISPQALYDFVRSHNSTFTLGDIETICQAAQKYDVNPALLIAITGQEQAFVPPGPDAARIRNNPFNVFYSWRVYNTNLSDAANIAANTLRHKLSVLPPSGENAILWINDPLNPWGIYATNPNWAIGVVAFFHDIVMRVGG